MNKQSNRLKKQNFKRKTAVFVHRLFSPLIQKCKQSHRLQGIWTFTLRASNVALRFVERISSLFVRSLLVLLRPPQRRQYRFQRFLWLRQCFYFIVSLSCLSILLGSLWLFVGAPRWQNKLQDNLEEFFVFLEQEHGIQIRFKMQNLYFLHKIELRDIQVRLEVPLQGIGAQSGEDIPPIPPLRTAPEPLPKEGYPREESRRQHLVYSPSPQNWLQALNQKIAYPHPQGKDKRTTLYVSVDRLQLNYSLLAMLQRSWRLLRTSQLLDASTVPQQQFAWQLFQLLQDIKQLDLGEVELQIISQKLPDSTTIPEEPQATSFPFTWQEFLQTLRTFPITINSFQFHLNLQQQLFEGKNIRFLLQPNSKRPTKRGLLDWYKTLLSLFPGSKQEPHSLLEEYNATHTDLQSSYFFDLQGRFRSDLTASPDQAFWGQIHANGGLAQNFDEGYLVLELQELYSNYASLKPTLFRIEYLPQALKLETLSDIRSLELELDYLFQERRFDLRLSTERFRLGDYVTLQNKQNSSSLSSLLAARLSGEGELQIHLNDLEDQTSTTQLDYRADMQIYLLQQDLSLLVNGQGDLQKFSAEALQISQDTWRANFRGNIPYDTLLPEGSLDFDWRSKNAGYRAQLTLQHSSKDTLVIETVRSQFSGLGLPKVESADTLLPGLPPWAQPQLQMLVFHERGSYYISSQIHVPLDQSQVQYAETSLEQLLRQVSSKLPSEFPPELPQVLYKQKQPEGPKYVDVDPFGETAYAPDNTEPNFYLLPVLGLSGSLHRKSPSLRLELSTLKWEQNSIAKGSVPISVLLGSKSPTSLDFVLPGLDASFWEMQGSMHSDLKDFQIWLENFQIKTLDAGRKLSIQGTLSPQEIRLNELQLQWDSLDISNRFLWKLKDKQGYGLLTVQKEGLNYQLKRMTLPTTKSKQDPSSVGWLLEGDHDLYAYADKQRYQISFQEFPLPKIPGLNTTRLQNYITTSTTLNNSTLSLQAQGSTDWKAQGSMGWKVEVPMFQLNFAEGNIYFPEGALMYLAGSWQAEELLFEQLALYEPQRQLLGQGSLRFAQPLAPVSLAPQIILEPLQNPGFIEEPSEKESEKEKEADVQELIEQDSELRDLPYLQAQPQVQDYKPLEPNFTEEQNFVERKGNWVGEFNFRGSPTEIGLRRGISLVEGGESLELNLFTEGQSFFTTLEGQLDATRLNQLFTLLQKRKTENLSQGTLKFKLQGEGEFDAELTEGLEGLEGQGQQASLKQLEGNWQLLDTQYAGRSLELASQLLWRNTERDGSSWILSDLYGNFGAMELERSFLSFRNDDDVQQIAGLLNYSIILQNQYFSSITVNLTRSKKELQLSDFNPTERELLRWQGSLYSYPIRSYAADTREQSGVSITALGSNLRDNIFRETSRQARFRPVYPGFDIFIEPRIIQDRQAELHLFRREQQDFAMGLRADSFWLQVGRAFPISFRAEGSNNAGSIDAQIQDLLIQPQLLNVLVPNDKILKKPVIQFSQGRIFGSLRIFGSIFDPSLDGSLNLENMVLTSPYFPEESPTINIQLISEGHVIMAKPFYIQFRDGRLYTPGYEETYLRHKSLQIMRYYLGFSAEGKEGIPLFYDAYGIQYQTNAKGSLRLEGNGQSGYLNTDLELNHLLMQGSQHYNSVRKEEKTFENGYIFSLDIRAKIGRSASLVYPQKTNPIFTTRLNPRDELLISYDGSSGEGSIDGRVALYDGELYLLGNQMDLRKGELTFAESFGQFSPDISLFFSLYSQDLQGQAIQINMDYQGELAKLADQGWSPNISSQPPLPEQRLRYLIATQLGAGGQEQTNSLVTTQNAFLSEVLARLGSNIVLKPVEELVRKGFKVFDEVDLKTGLLGNLLDDYLEINYSADDLVASNTDTNWLKYLDNTHMSLGTYVDRDNTILLSFNLDFLYDSQDTSSILFAHDGLQFIPGLGLKFNTPLLDISLDVGFAHIDDFFITDSSLLLEWSLSDFLNRRRLASVTDDDERDELIMYAEE